MNDTEEAALIAREDYDEHMHEVFARNDDEFEPSRVRPKWLGHLSDGALSMVLILVVVLLVSAFYVAPLAMFLRGWLWKN